MNSTIRQAARDGNHGTALENTNLRGYFTANPFKLLHFYYAGIAVLWLVFAWRLL
jgi:hypothetical protein